MSKKTTTPLFILTIFLTSNLCVSCARAQEKRLHALFAGTDYSLAGAGVGWISLIFYFRPDGTFCSQLEEPDWKTRVDGTYTVQGDKIIVNEEGDDEPLIITLSDGGAVGVSGGAVLVKMDPANHIPPGYYSFEAAMGGGGIGTNSPYIGTSDGMWWHFDGKGNFKCEGFSAVSVIGDQMAGGSVSPDPLSGEGTYSIKNSELALRFTDGRVYNLSFFCSEVSPVMAVINGDICFKADQ